MLRRQLLTLPTVVITLAIGCSRPADSPRAEYKHSDQVMGTFAEVKAVAPNAEVAKAAVAAAYARFDDVNRLMSDYVDDSDIGRLNQLAAGQLLTVAPETFRCLQRGVVISTESGGAFDMTCRPLVLCWRAAAKAQRLPTEQELSNVRQAVGYEKIVLDEGSRTVMLTVDNMQVDLGGIAKGYALDLAWQAMREKGATSAMIDVGGDVVAMGTRADGKPWRIGVRHPFQDGMYCTLRLRDCAVATSGVQQQFFEIDGRRYSHIIDPRTGQPAAQSPSVTVIASDGLTADAWATAFSVLSIAEAQPMAEQLDGIEVLWISGPAESPQVVQTSGFAAYVTE
ncbi:MAG: FAD:protein FMN transferase [Phycisphaerae bacterium]|nr:FAD:protein FMN transferase [Phycisphaerae bacterium]